MTTSGDDDNVQVCKCGLTLSLDRPTVACKRCGVTWSLDADHPVEQIRPLPQPTHGAPTSIH